MGDYTHYINSITHFSAYCNRHIFTNMPPRNDVYYYDILRRKILEDNNLNVRIKKETE